MNASARREDSRASLDCALPRACSARTLRRRRASPSAALGRLLLTGLVCGGTLPIPAPVSATASAANWLTDSKATTAPTTTSAPATKRPSGATVSAATPPVPPTPPTFEKPADDLYGGPARSDAKSQASNDSQPQAGLPDTAKDKNAQKATGMAVVPAPLANTLKSFTSKTLGGWMSPPTPDGKTTQAKAAPKDATRPAATATGSAAGHVMTTAAATSVRPAPNSGRFDPDFGPAGHFVSDADEQASQAQPLPVMPRSAVPMPDVAVPENLKPAVATDEPVSLVSWLSSYAGGHGHGGGDACRDIRLTDTCCPTWEAQIDALFLWQGNIPSRSLYVDSATGATALDANQLYAPAAIAPRYALTYHRDDCRAIEVNYFQVWGFNAKQTIGPQTDAAGDGIFAANNLVGPDYNQVSDALVTSSANIQSLEVNLRRNDGGMIEWISGFRWLQWGQNLTMTDSITAAGADAGNNLTTVDTLNNLYGWQWGGDMMLWNAGRWLRVNGVAKAGVYYNHQASQNTFYTDFVEPANTVNAAASRDAVAFVGETGVNASLALTNWLSWRTGYTFFWLGGMATPVRQLGLSGTSGTASINTTGSVLLHGVNTGLEARW